LFPLIEFFPANHPDLPILVQESIFINKKMFTGDTINVRRLIYEKPLGHDSNWRRLWGTKIEAAALNPEGAFLARIRAPNPGSNDAALHTVRELRRTETAGSNCK
jgi:hypothetical protein